MKFKVRYSKNEYYNDSKKLLLYEIAYDKPLVLFLSIYGVILVIFLFISLFDFNYFLKEIKLLTYSLGIGILAMIIHSIYFYFSRLKKIKYSSKYLPDKEEYIKFDDDNVVLSWNNQTLEYSWKIFKKAIRLGDTIFIIPHKKFPLIRLNPTEIKNFNYDIVIVFLRKKVRCHGTRSQ